MLNQNDYTAVFDASPDAMLVVDADGVIRDLEALRKDGTTIPVEISLSPSNLGTGDPHVICAVP